MTNADHTHQESPPFHYAVNCRRSVAIKAKASILRCQDRAVHNRSFCTWSVSLYSLYLSWHSSSMKYSTETKHTVQAGSKIRKTKNTRQLQCRIPRLKTERWSTEKQRKHYLNYNHTLPLHRNHKKTGLKHKVRSIREEKSMLYCYPPFSLWYSVQQSIVLSPGTWMTLRLFSHPNT